MNAKAFSSLVLAAALASPALARTIERQAALDGLVAAEKAFSRTAAEKGIRDSFLDFMADDGGMFRPDPGIAKECMPARREIPGVLSGYPASTPTGPSPGPAGSRRAPRPTRRCWRTTSACSGEAGP